MKEKYLPIGTVVTLKNATKKVMITGYLPMSEENKMFDYNACTYPEGVLTADKTLAFNHDQIDKIDFMGFEDDEYKNFDNSLKDLVINWEKLKNVELPIEKEPQPTEEKSEKNE